MNGQIIQEPDALVPILIEANDLRPEQTELLMSTLDSLLNPLAKHVEAHDIVTVNAALKGARNVLKEEGIYDLAPAYIEQRLEQVEAETLSSDRAPGAYDPPLTIN